jgi:hypothetical protein
MGNGNGNNMNTDEIVKKLSVRKEGYEYPIECFFYSETIRIAGEFSSGNIDNLDIRQILITEQNYLLLPNTISEAKKREYIGKWIVVFSKL